MSDSIFQLISSSVGYVSHLCIISWPIHLWLFHHVSFLPTLHSQFTICHFETWIPIVCFIATRKNGFYISVVNSSSRTFLGVLIFVPFLTKTSISFLLGTTRGTGEVCSGVFWGMRESVVSDSGRRHWFFFWVGGIGNGKRRHRGPWSSSYVRCMSRPQTTQIYVFMFCIMSYII
jgi:hypothetical protein